MTCVYVHTSYRQEDDSLADVGACGGSSSSSTTSSTTSRTAAEDGWRQAALALANDVAEDRVVAQGFADAAGLCARKLAGDTSERMEVMEEIKAAVNRVQSSVPWMERLAIALDKAWPLEIGRPGHPDVLSRKSLLDHGATAVLHCISADLVASSGKCKRSTSVSLDNNCPRPTRLNIIRTTSCTARRRGSNRQECCLGLRWLAAVRRPVPATVSARSRPQ